jgi:colanic acid biosynthesis glycosyl transferase WcaI
MTAGASSMANCGRRRVLIVGINYEPEHSGIAPYTTSAAKHLAAAGNEVLVLTGIPHYPHWTVPDGFRRRLRLEERSAGVLVRRLRHFVPASQSAIKRGLYEATFGAHVTAQHLPWRPHVVLAVVPSLMGAAAAAQVARRERVPLGVWLQDLMGRSAKQTGIGGGPTAALTELVERWLVGQAAGVAVIGDSFRSHAEWLGVPASRLHYMPNWSHVNLPKHDRQLMRKHLGWPQDVTIALHSGNMGLKQGLENVVAAARLADHEGKKVRFVLMGDGSQRTTLEALARGLRTLEFRPPVPSDHYTDILAAADILVVNERVGVLDMSLPSKLTSYFLAGRPIVAAVHPRGGTADQVRCAGAGLVVHSGQPDCLLNTVCTLAEDQATARHLGDAARSYAELRLDEPTAMRRLDHFLDQLISRGPRESQPSPIMDGEPSVETSPFKIP